MTLSLQLFCSFFNQRSCIDVGGPSSNASEDVIFLFGWLVFCGLGISYSLSFLNEMTLHMLLVLDVDDGVSVELVNAPICLKLGVEPILPTWFSKFLILTS